MKQYKKGSAIVVIIIVIVATLFGLIGYIIWQKFFNIPAKVATTSITNNQARVRPTTKTYTGDNFTTQYVDTWTVDAKESPDGPLVTFTSPDFKAAMEVGAEKGAKVTLSVTPSTGDVQEYVKDFLTRVGKSPEAYGQVDVAGQTAYEFNYLAEGADVYYTLFNYKGKNYTFVYLPAVDQADTYSLASNIIIDSFTFR